MYINKIRNTCDYSVTCSFDSDCYEGSCSFGFCSNNISPDYDGLGGGLIALVVLAPIITTFLIVVCIVAIVKSSVNRPTRITNSTFHAPPPTRFMAPNQQQTIYTVQQQNQQQQQFVNQANEAPPSYENSVPTMYEQSQPINPQQSTGYGATQPAPNATAPTAIGGVTYPNDAEGYTKKY